MFSLKNVFLLIKVVKSYRKVDKYAKKTQKVEENLF